MSEWEEITLGEVVNFTTGKLNSNAATSDGKYPFFTCSPETLKIDNYAFDCNAILLAGNNANAIYSIKIYSGKFNAYQRTYVITLKDSLISNLRYLYYVLTLKLNHFKEISQGSATKFLTTVILNNLQIKLPLLEEQNRITNILSCLDAKIENLRRQNETLEQIAQTLFKHWFIDFEFPNAIGKPYKSSGGAMFASELGDIPEGWKFSTIGDEVETVGGGTPSTTEPSYWENGDIPWYSPTDLTKAKTLFSIDSEKKITKLGLQKSSARLFPKYSLLLTSRATIGEVTINTKEACTNQGFITIIPNTKFSVYFLYGWLLTKIGVIKQLASGSTFPEISKTNFRSRSVESDMRLSQKWTHYSCKKRDFSLISLSS
jgi:type I restriction enzyme S subunit